MSVRKGTAQQRDPVEAARERHAASYQPDLKLAVFYCAADLDLPALAKALHEQFGDVNNEKLMDRVERDMDMRGNSFSLFQTAISLESTAEQRTAALTQAMQDLEKRNRDLEASNETVQLETESLPFDLRRATGHPLSVLQPQVDAKGLQLRLDWPADLPTAVIGDPTRFSQIVTNLMGNAIKFTAAGSVSLRARVAAADGAALPLHFEVEDTGIGIAPDALPRLFQSFTQTDSSITRKYGGTGTGLAIVRRLCEPMGGDCGVRGELGRGSTFWFTLALKRGRQDRSAQATGVFQVLRPRRTDAADAPGLHVLLVEDNLTNQEVTLGMLELLGARARVADNGLRELAAAINRGCPQHPLPATDTPREMSA